MPNKGPPKQGDGTKGFSFQDCVNEIISGKVPNGFRECVLATLGTYFRAITNLTYLVPGTWYSKPFRKVITKTIKSVYGSTSHKGPQPSFLLSTLVDPISILFHA